MSSGGALPVLASKVHEPAALQPWRFHSWQRPEPGRCGMDALALESGQSHGCIHAWRKAQVEDSRCRAAAPFGGHVLPIRAWDFLAGCHTSQGFAAPGVQVRRTSVHGPWPVFRRSTV